MDLLDVRHGRDHPVRDRIHAGQTKVVLSNQGDGGRDRRRNVWPA